MMERYYFLFALAIIWIIFAVVQDLKRTEVANWLNFSLIAFALAYRAFYAVINDSLGFLWFGLLGFGLFFVLGHVLYYSKVFGGGDSKLLMGLGAILPIESYYSLLYEGLGYIVVLFTVGAVYSLIYSGYLASKSFNSFKKVFWNILGRMKLIFLIAGFAFIIGFFMQESLPNLTLFFISFFFILGLFYAFLFSVERCCMVKWIVPSKLMEGDWLERNVKIGKGIIKRSVHGLSWEEIKLLRKVGKKVLIKGGIPFTPAFLISFVIMVYAWVVLEFRFFDFLSSFS